MVQADDIDYRGGANRVSLREAQSNFARFGASDAERKDRVRPPLPHER